VSAAPPHAIAVVLVAAVADNGVIGRGNAMPWRLGTDLQRFKALTIGKPVVMGRKTFLSIGRPLPGRTNVVVSRDPGFAAAGVLAASDLASALAAARADAMRRGVREIAVVGGAEIYAQCLPLADRLEITHVHARPDGDSLFPPIDWSQWRALARSEHPPGPRDEVSFSHVAYERK
jgi:dihydrofolate reductase